jgi:hypothetical protein
MQTHSITIDVKDEKDEKKKPESKVQPGLLRCCALSSSCAQR